MKNIVLLPLLIGAVVLGVIAVVLMALTFFLEIIGFKVIPDQPSHI